MAEISRRAVIALLGAGTLAAGAQYGAEAVGSSPGPNSAEPGADNPIQAENRRPGSRDWKIGAGSTVAADDLGRQIKGYASAASVNLGESIDF
ncbi:MAG: N,N-dimethylformamidase beta subunit family domain-containing protein, partial [Actinocrinis sp.]